MQPYSKLDDRPRQSEKVTAMGAKRSFTNVIVHAIREFIALLCVVVLVPGNTVAVHAQQTTAPTQQPATKLPPEQLDSLVAPIALYPDPLLSQTLVASTYPLEVVQLKQWLDQHKDLKDKALVDAVEKQNWDPSIQAMAALPDVAKQLADNIKWTADLGNAFLAQQNDVMDAVQRMRKKANDAGTLKSSEQQKVETKVVESKQVIVIEQANPQVIYVPSYNPTVVYGPPVYPYPPIYYPPVGYYAAGMAISFGIGIAMGAAWGGGWGWGCGWGGNNDITINRNNNFNRNTSINGGNRASQLPARAGGVGGGWRVVGVGGAGVVAWVVQATVHRSYLPAVIPGSITRSTVVARLTPTEPLRIGSVALHAAIPCPTDRRMHVRTSVRNLGSSRQGAAICRTVARVPAQAPGI